MGFEQVENGICSLPIFSVNVYSHFTLTKGTAGW